MTHHNTGPLARGDPRGEQGGGSAVDRTIAAPGHLMQGAHSKTSTRQVRIDHRQTERQHYRRVAATGFNSLDLFAQGINGGT